MSYVTAVFAVFARLLCPTRGVHTSPLGYVRELAGELRRRRARRVRRYAQDLPVLAEPEPAEESAPVVPAPRRPVDDVLTAVPRQTSVLGERLGSAFEADAAGAADDLVRGYYRAWEHRQKLLRADRSRLGLAVLMDLAGSESRVEVPA